MVCESIVGQRIEQFDTRHGGDSVEAAGWIYYRNGAMREVSPYGALVDPPRNELDCAKRKLFYWETKVKRATKKFEDRRNHMIRHAKAAMADRQCPPPQVEVDAAVEELRELRSLAEEAQNWCNGAREDVERLEPSSITERREQTSRNFEAQQDLLNQIHEIEL